MIITHELNVMMDGAVFEPFEVRQGDENSHLLIFRLPQIEADAQAARLKITPQGNTLPYLYDCLYNGETASVTPTSEAWSAGGAARLQLEIMEGTSILWQSAIFTVRVSPSLDPTGGITPEQGETWYDKLNEAAQEATEAAQEAQEATQGVDALKVWEAYDNGTTYMPLNKVAYNGSSYICVAETTGNAPPDPAYWQLIAAKGQDAQAEYGLPPGGATGQVLAKIDDDNYNVKWHTPALALSHTLTASGWATGQTITDTAITATNRINIKLAAGYTSAQAAIYNDMLSRVTVSRAPGSITITITGQAPSANINVILEISTDAGQVSLIPVAMIASNDNLLHNADWSNRDTIINTMGQNSYIGPGYTIDRWYVPTGCILAVQDNGILYTCNAATNLLRHIIEFPAAYAGKTLTLSVKGEGQNGTRFHVYINPGTSATSNYVSSGIATVTATVPADVTEMFLGLRCDTAGGSVLLSGAKLEIGTTSTLANGTPQDYAQKQETCRRFRQRILQSAGTGVYAANSETTTTAVYAFMPLPTPLRRIPDVIVSPDCYIASYSSNTPIATITGATTIRRLDNGVFMFLTTSDPITPWTQYRLRIPTGGYIDLNANM